MQKAYVDLSRPFLSWSILAARIRIPTDLPETLPKHARNHLFEIIFRPGACRASRGLPEPIPDLLTRFTRSYPLHPCCIFVLPVLTRCILDHSQMHGNPSKSIRINGDPLKSFKIYANPRASHVKSTRHHAKSVRRPFPPFSFLVYPGS